MIKRMGAYGAEAEKELEDLLKKCEEADYSHGILLEAMKYAIGPVNRRGDDVVTWLKDWMEGDEDTMRELCDWMQSDIFKGGKIV